MLLLLQADFVAVAARQPAGTGSAQILRSMSPNSSHPTAEKAYAELDRIAARLAEDDLSADTLELYVVDEHREPLPRPGAH